MPGQSQYHENAELLVPLTHYCARHCSKYSKAACSLILNDHDPRYRIGATADNEAKGPSS